MTITLIQFGQLPAVRIAAPDGAQATVTLYGAHLVSWTDAHGRERMFCSTLSSLDGKRAIRGGVPVIFPQFAARGTGMRHGFARVSTWRASTSGEQDGAAFAEFVLAPQDLTPSVAEAWPHGFALTLRVTVGADELAMTLDVHNTGKAPFPFAAALHTYHLVDDLGAVRVDGVQADTLTIADAFDHVFENVGGTVVLESGAGKLRHEQSGFTDAVVWNPGAADAAALADMQDDEFRRFVCIEPALVDPRKLDAGASWRGEYRLAAV